MSIMRSPTISLSVNIQLDKLGQMNALIINGHLIIKGAIDDSNHGLKLLSLGLPNWPLYLNYYTKGVIVGKWSVYS